MSTDPAPAPDTGAAKPTRQVVDRSNPHLGFFVYDTPAGRALNPPEIAEVDAEVRAPQPVGLTAFMHLRAIAKKQRKKQRARRAVRGTELPKNNPYVGFFGHAARGVHRYDPLRQFLSDCSADTASRSTSRVHDRVTVDDTESDDGSWLIEIESVD